MILVLAVSLPVQGQEGTLQEGIVQYRKGNFEEALPIFLEARKQDPRNPGAAFFLGLTYKQLANYEKAAEHLRDAVTLTPRIREALVELIDVLYQLPQEKNLEEAGRWVEVARKEGIFPAKVAFLDGLIHQKQRKYREACALFEEAKALDPGLAQSADFQIGICYVRDRDLKQAKERFHASIQYAPQSDLAGFARQYLDLVEKRIEQERPFRATLGLFAGYDTNVVLKPIESEVAPDVTDEGSLFYSPQVRLDYIPQFKSPFLFNAQYAFNGNFHRKHATTHDSIGNSFYVAPGYNFGRYALNLAVSYNHVLVRVPSYEQYLDYLSAGPLFRMLILDNHMLELFAGYDHKEYAQPPLIPDEDRDSKGMRASASWIHSYRPGGFINLRYEYGRENTDGANWENDSHRFTLNTAYPLMDRLKLQVGAQLFLQDFDNTHTIFRVNRKDETYQASMGLIWEMLRNTNLIVQYTWIRADSNVSIYDYERNLYTAGVEYRF